MINEALIKMTARTLKRVGDEGTHKVAIGALTECDIGRPLTTVEIDDAVAFLVDHGFAGVIKDTFGRNIYFLTQAGKNFLAQ